MKHLFLVLSLALYSAWGVALEIEIDDKLFATADNDSRANTPYTSSMAPLATEDLLSHVNLYGQFFTFEQVMASLSPYLESQFQTIIIGNTATEGSQSDLIPFQHARVLHKKDKSLPIFERSNGKITGILFKNLSAIEGVPELVPVSSGRPGNNGIRTYSGIFRVHTASSKNKLSTSPGAPMSYSVYIDAIYAGGRRAGVAIHGTPKKNHHLLGKSRASHGCLRTFPAIAEKIYKHVFSDSLWSEELPKFNPYDNFPNEDVQNGISGSDEGTSTLFIIFNGFDGNTQDI